MRVRTAKTLAQRIELDYFKRAHGLRWWRYALSILAPVVAVLWLGGYAAVGSSTPYSAGPVSRAHAFAEKRCDVCHVGSGNGARFRTHVTDQACSACHEGPPHGESQATPPSCTTCHAEHGGRVQLARVDDRFCVTCHAAPSPDASTSPDPIVAVGTFPAAHPEFAVLRNHVRDPGGIKFNHAVHLSKNGIKGPDGVERLDCADCHEPDVAADMGRRVLLTGLMTRVTYQDTCARCHPLFFDEKIDEPAPHGKKPALVRAAMSDALARYIAAHPRDLANAGETVRRVPLNFPRPPEPPARNAAEWVTRRLAFDERRMWRGTCGLCHVAGPGAAAAAGERPLPAYPETRITARWMPRASFDHRAHQMVRCQDCHAAEGSRDTADVLMPSISTCATCHAPSKGAEDRCFECHQYHDWAKAHAVTPGFTLGDFK